MRDYILFYLNGQRFEVRGEKTQMMFADFLRYELGKVGTKIVCAEGDCGACSVLKCFPFPDFKKPQFHAVNSCIATVAQMDCSVLVTVEGIAKGETLHPVQQAMVDCHGSQCGFCTPGFVVTMAGLVEKRIAKKDDSQITKKEAKNYLTGNLCRCTGYEPIIESLCSVVPKTCPSLVSRYLTKEVLGDLKTQSSKELFVETDEFSYFAPRTLSAASRYLKKYKNARIVAGGTDLGVLLNKRNLEQSHYLSLHLVEKFYEQKKLGNKYFVGSKVTIADLRSHLEKQEKRIADFLDLFASPQIKNKATLVGNVINASPIADTLPLLMVTEARVLILTEKSIKKWVALSDFYLGYKKLNMSKADIVLGVEFELPSKAAYFRCFKTSQRKDLDISCVNAAFNIELNKKNLISDVKIAFGGLGATVIRLKRAEEYLLKNEVNVESYLKVADIAMSDLSFISDLRGSAQYRRQLVKNILFTVFKELNPEKFKHNANEYFGMNL